MASTKKTIDVSKGELMKTLTEKHQEIQNLAFKGAGSKIANVRRPRQLRKEIARALTEVNNQPKDTK